MPSLIENVNKSWVLAQGTITLTRNGGGTYSIDNSLRSMPLFDDGGGTIYPLGFGYVGGVQALQYWSGATAQVSYVFDELLNWIELSYDSTTGITSRSDYGTYSIA